MDTENPIEGNSTDGGADVAKQPVSQPVSQPSAEDFAALNKRLAELESQNRSLQSGKDKRWNEVMPVIKRVAERLGIDESKVLQAQREEVLDSLIAERLAPSSVQTPGTGQAGAVHVEVSNIVQEYGLDLNDPSVAAFVRDNKFNDKDQAELAVARLGKRLKSQPSPLPEQNAVSTTGKAVMRADVEALTREYIEKVKANAGKRDAIKALKADYAQKGVPVDQINWTR